MLRSLALFVLVCSFTAKAAEAPRYEDLIFQGSEAERKGLLGRALSLYKQAQDLNPNRVDAFFLFGRVLTIQRKSEEAVAAFDRALALEPKASTAYKLRGVESFKLGKIEKSLEDFDRYLALEPKQTPYQWQRGISLYYLGKYDEGRKQFETHQGVNSQDVENAVWHFLCVARSESFAKARAALIPIKEDRRVPMMEVFNLFAGTGAEEDIMKAVKRGNPTPAEVDRRNFYAHLYLGLYYEAKGDSKKTFDHMKDAATTFPEDDYMGDVARIHFKRLLQMNGK